MHSLLEGMRCADKDNAQGVISALRDFVPLIDDLSALINRMKDELDPHVFYYHIRPFLAGSKGMASAGLPNGVIYDTGAGNEEYRQYAGGSNAQSSLIQFFDIALDVKHYPTGQKGPVDVAKTKNGTAPPPPQHNFLHESRMYMPRQHREFLERVQMVSNIRKYVEQRPDNKELTEAYNACIFALTQFRNVHMAVVARYIVNMRSKPVEWVRGGETSQGMNIAVASSNDDEGKDSLRGTGGSDLLAFLKQTRDETAAAATKLAAPVKSVAYQAFVAQGRAARAARELLSAGWDFGGSGEQNGERQRVVGAWPSES